MKEKNIINFTKASIIALLPPKRGMETFCDTKEKGLSLYITTAGHKSFVVRKRIQGQNKRIIIGHFPAMTIDEARKAAQKIKGQIAEGKNPNAEKQKLLQEPTFGEAFKIFLERYAKVERKTWKENERDVNRMLAHLFNRKLSAITKFEIQNLHDTIGRENGIYRANKILARIRSIYNKTISWGWEGTNPTLGIKKFKEQKRDRFVLQDEFPKLMAALEADQNEDMKDFFLLCLYTGARKSNILSMRWEDIDFSINEWRIPDTKNGDPVRVPLIAQSLEILKNRSPLRDSSTWVFPNKASKTGHLVEPKTAWKRVLERAGLKNLRIHDLRRTMGSYQAIAGASLAIIGKSLGHKSHQSTAIYARLSNDPVRASMEAAFDFTKTVKKA